MFHPRCGTMHVLLRPPRDTSAIGLAVGILGVYIGYVRCDGVTLHVYTGHVKKE